MPSRIEIAKRLAADGFYVFPVLENDKRPAIKNFPKLASRDEAEIERWFFDPVMGLERPLNIGISTSKFAEFEHLLVIDIDTKKAGHNTLLELEMKGFEFPKTRTQKTPTGGEHLIYSVLTPVKNGVDVLGAGLDVRGQGGYIVGVGSEVDAGTYEMDLTPVVRAPDWLVDRIGKPKEKSKKEPTKKALEDRAAKRAAYYLQNEAPIAVEGSGGDQTTYTVAAHVKDLGASVELAKILMGAVWNQRCEPPWSEEELHSKIENAFKYSKNTEGEEAPESQFEAIEEEAEKSFLDRINDKFAIVFQDGGHVIMEETVEEDGKRKLSFHPENSFKRMFSTQTLEEGRRSSTYAEVWLDWKGRREYRGLCFAPEREARNGYFNLWNGFTVKPRPMAEANDEQKRGLEMYLSHVKDNVCAGDADLFKWIMGYFAHMIQKPFERPLTTLVFKGRKGTGKNVAIDRVGALLGHRHFLTAHDSRYLTSNFNGHLDSCLCLVLDEAFWSGDKSADGKLKGITTQKTILIERKGKEPYTVDNLVRLVVIGNEDWLVPATADERRYAVFEMGESRMQDTEFFREMREIMDERGGSSFLLQWLKDFDLSQIDVNIAPHTSALDDQKLQSLNPIEEWVFESLTNGTISHADFDTDWPDTVDTDRLRETYSRYARSRGVKTRVPNSRSFGIKIKSLIPEIKRTKRKELGKSIWVYKMPTLAESRASWDRLFKTKTDWDN